MRSRRELVLLLTACLLLLACTAEAESIYNFGAKCDGVKDDSLAIQAAINAGGTVTFAAGAATCLAKNLTVRSNTILELAGTTLDMGSLTPPQTWGIRTSLGATNVTIRGGVLQGHRLPTRGYAIGIRIDGADNVVVEGTRILDWPTDGIWVGGVGGLVPNGRSTHVRISAVEIGNCGRNGVSISNADGVRIERSHIHDIHGDPGAAVDGEPNPGDRLSGLVISDCILARSDIGAYLQIGGGLPGLDYAVLNNVFTDNVRYGLVCNGVIGLHVFNNVIKGGAIGMSIGAPSADRLSTDVTVENNVIGGIRGLIIAGAKNVRVMGNSMAGGKPETPVLGVSGTVILMGNTEAQ